MKKLGVIVDHLGLSQSNFFMVYNLNLIVQSSLLDCCVFHNQWRNQVLPHLFTVCQDNEIWDYTGTVIATDVRSARKLLSAPGPEKKYFYVWDLFWRSLNNFPHSVIRDILNNDEIGLIARSSSHFKLLTRLFKKPEFVLEDWNPKSILEKIGA